MSRKPKPVLPLLNELKANLKYDPITGHLYWIYSRHKIAAGQRAELYTKGNPHYIISWNGQLYKAHRIIYLLMTEQEPPDELDHEDTDGFNNIWTNIREATRNQNCANRNFKNPYGKGVIFHKATGKFMAQMGHNKKKIYLGIFNTPEEAHEAYKEASIRLQGEYSRFS